MSLSQRVATLKEWHCAHHGNYAARHLIGRAGAVDRGAPRLRVVYLAPLTGIPRDYERAIRVALVAIQDCTGSAPDFFIVRTQTNSARDARSAVLPVAVLEVLSDAQRACRKARDSSTAGLVCDWHGVPSRALVTGSPGLTIMGQGLYRD